MGFFSNVIGSITGATQASKAAKKAAKIQSQFAQQGIDEQRNILQMQQDLFNSIASQMSPYITTGTGALGGQADLLGINGPEAQQAAIQALENSPQFQSLVDQGERAILQNASATGGLRGGNVQAALAKYRPEVLSSLINQQFANLGGLSGLGNQTLGLQAGLGASALGAYGNTGTNISNLLQSQGAYQAGGELAQGFLPRQNFSDLLNFAKIGLGGGLF